MILPFSTQINGKPTYFVEKIHSGLVQNQPELSFELDGSDYPFSMEVLAACKPKIHTLREDKNERWERGMMIDFFINCRQPNMFRFAPKTPVVSTQTVFMSYGYNDLIHISVGEREFFGYSERLEFAQNDGFDTWEHFFNYFYPIIEATPNNFLKLKLIHWTDKRY